MENEEHILYNNEFDITSDGLVKDYVRYLSYNEDFSNAKHSAILLLKHLKDNFDIFKFQNSQIPDYPDNKELKLLAMIYRTHFVINFCKPFVESQGRGELTFKNVKIFLDNDNQYDELVHIKEVLRNKLIAHNEHYYGEEYKLIAEIFISDDDVRTIGERYTRGEDPVIGYRVIPSGKKNALPDNIQVAEGYISLTDKLMEYCSINIKEKHTAILNKYQPIHIADFFKNIDYWAKNIRKKSN